MENPRSIPATPALHQTVRSLYENARTSVIINGEISEPYVVKCGVRQGDPLSCFLFNLGIEPLACMIRKSEELHGFSIQGANERLLINLFADDTVVYLSERDKFDNLQTILDEWCQAPGANFNKEKMKILQIG